MCQVFIVKSRRDPIQILDWSHSFDYIENLPKTCRNSVILAIHQEKYEKWRSKQSAVLQVRCSSCDWFFASLDDLSSHQRLGTVIFILPFLERFSKIHKSDP